MSGRAEEFHAFVGDRASPLHRTAYLLCGDWHLAQDVVQETLVKAYRNWTRVRRAGNPDAYVRRILINEVRDRWRVGTRPFRSRTFPMSSVFSPTAPMTIARRERLRQACGL